MTEARQRLTAARSPGPWPVSPGQGLRPGETGATLDGEHQVHVLSERLELPVFTMADTGRPARMNSGAAGWAVAVAGRTATSSGYFGGGVPSPGAPSRVPVGGAA